MTHCTGKAVHVNRKVLPMQSKGTHLPILSTKEQPDRRGINIFTPSNNVVIATATISSNKALTADQKAEIFLTQLYNKSDDVCAQFANIIVTPRLALSCDVCSGVLVLEWSCIRASVRGCTSTKSSCAQDWCERKAKSSQYSRLACVRQMFKGPCSRYARQNEGPRCMRD